MKNILRSSRRQGASASEQRVNGRKGIGLIEVIVAMVILGLTLSSLVPIMYSMSRSSVSVSGKAYRNGVLMHEVNRLVALPYDSIPVGITTFTVTTGKYPHTRTITISEPVANLKLVKVKVVPSNLVLKPDSVSFNRTRARTSKYLCTTCQ